MIIIIIPTDYTAKDCRSCEAPLLVSPPITQVEFSTLAIYLINDINYNRCAWGLGSKSDDSFQQTQKKEILIGNIILIG